MRPEFDVHMLNDDGKKKAVEIAEKFSEILDYVEGLHAGERSAAQPIEIMQATEHLRMACFYAKRVMAQAPQNQSSPSKSLEVFVSQTRVVTDPLSNPSLGANPAAKLSTIDWSKY